MFTNQTFSVFITANTETERVHWRNQFGARLSELAGGATVIPCYGLWVSGETGQLVSENSDLVFTFCDNPADIAQEIRPIVSEYIREARQEACLIVVGGNPHFISQDEI